MKYSHVDSTGMPWRMKGSRPVSALADFIMGPINRPKSYKKKKKK